MAGQQRPRGELPPGWACRAGLSLLLNPARGGKGGGEQLTPFQPWRSTKGFKASRGGSLGKVGVVQSLARARARPRPSPSPAAHGSRASGELLTQDPTKGRRWEESQLCSPAPDPLCQKLFCTSRSRLSRNPAQPLVPPLCRALAALPASAQRSGRSGFIQRPRATGWTCYPQVPFWGLPGFKEKTGKTSTGPGKGGRSFWDWRPTCFPSSNQHSVLAATAPLQEKSHKERAAQLV